MSLIKKLFDFFKTGEPSAIERNVVVDKSKNEEKSPTIEDLMQDEEVANLLLASKNLFSKYKKETTLLRPHISEKEIDFTKSKIGGVPNLNGFQIWPMCDECNTPLNFVIQLYKTDFPSFYFPDDKNIFQLFRCPNDKCSKYSEYYDCKMFHYYRKVVKDKNNEIDIPQLDDTKYPYFEEKVRECYFEPEISDDYPSWGSVKPLDSVDLSNLIKKYGQDIIFDLFWRSFSTKLATKFGGYPYWAQSPNEPICGCGSGKEFFFQLAGDDDIGLLLGDAGCIKYFRCNNCGEKSIESRWDCG